MKVEIDADGEVGSERKVSVQIDPWDTWSLDATLAHIIFPALKQLKEQKQGVPSTYFSGDDYEQEAFEEAKQKWHADLDKMVASFQYLVEEGISGVEREDIQEGFRLFGQHYTDLWS